MSDALEQLRRRIDECDAQIVRWINERLRVAKEIGEYKAARGMKIRVPGREEEVIARVLGHNGGPCPPEVLERLYRLLIDAAVALEETT